MSLSGNIILIGMPAAGKSTVGKLAAEKFGARFLDGDEYIFEQTKKKPQEIIDKYGEDYFLRLENELLASSDALKSGGVVFAPGGSVIYSENLMKYLRSRGTIIFLDLSLEEIQNRLSQSPPRGIIGLAGKTLDDLYKERIPLYQKYADITMRCDNLSEEEIINQMENYI